MACAIQNAMHEVNAWNRAQGLPAVEMGIGIHSGELVVGNIGSGCGPSTAWSARRLT